MRDRCTQLSKQWYARDGGETEVRVDGYIVDVVQDGCLIEIQTGSFALDQRQATALTQTHRVLLAYPVALESWLVQPTTDGARPVRRKSPKRGSALALFAELVSFPGLITESQLRDRYRVHARGRSAAPGCPRGWRRHGWVVDDRILLEVVEAQRYREPSDFASLLPDELGASFTTADLACALRRRRAFSQKMAYCLGDGCSR